MKSSLVILLLLLPVTLALHCWKDTKFCNPDDRLYDSKCDISKNRIPDLRFFQKDISGFCRDNNDIVFRVRPRDWPTQLPSGVVCAGNRHSPKAASYAQRLAKAIQMKNPKFVKGGGIIKCCEAILNKGCA
ncbi:MAG: hypothetical protein JOS17DRAFT_780801 [Linnemannia elongata]|nr:MAG: hypothetical protein JOS17DRAFT_780801 [Linnemannia elongata]